MTGTAISNRLTRPHFYTHLNGAIYFKMLQTSFVPCVEATAILQEDGAPAHYVHTVNI
jgi:hypothetical protein